MILIRKLEIKIKNKLKVLFIVPEVRLDSEPNHIPFWAGILAAIVEQKGGQVAILDLNALRTKYGGKQVPSEIIVKEISSEKWDMVGIGGLTTTYARIKQLAPLIRKYSPDSLFVGGGGWSTYNPTEILELTAAQKDSVDDNLQKLLVKRLICQKKIIY